MLEFLNGTFDKTHVLDSWQTSMANLGMTLLQEMEVFHKENYEQTDANCHCAVNAAFSNDQFGEIEAVSILQTQMELYFCSWNNVRIILPKTSHDLKHQWHQFS